MKQTLYLLKCISDSPNCYYKNFYLEITNFGNPIKFGTWQPDWKRATLFSDDPKDYLNFSWLKKEIEFLSSKSSHKESDFKIVPITVEMED